MVKLSDYGLPISLYSKENGSTLCHAAPEVFNGQRELKSDVWSLGITLLELTEGRNHYEDAVYRATVQYRVCQNEPPSLSSEKWSAEYVDFVGKCLVKDVNKRRSVKQLMEVSNWVMA